MVKRYVPESGDIVWLDLDLAAGHEQAGRCPALVLTPAAYNEASGLAVVCPLTSVRKEYPFAIPTVVAGREGALLADYVRSVDWRGRRATRLEKAAPELLETTRRYLGILLGLPSQR